MDGGPSVGLVTGDAGAVAGYGTTRSEADRLRRRSRSVGRPAQWLEKGSKTESTDSAAGGERCRAAEKGKAEKGEAVVEVAALVG
jgi:hypothetical protein